MSNKIKDIIENLKHNKYNQDEMKEIAKKFNITIKTKEQRLIEIVNYLKKDYIPYPLITEEKNFFKKLYEKKEFYQNRYKQLLLSENEDPQKELCPSEYKRFQLLNHQINIRNYLNIHTPYNGLLVFNNLGSGKTLTAIIIAEVYKNNLNNNSRKSLVLVSGNTIEENFRKEIHDINKGYNQGTFSSYINYNYYDNDKVKQQKVDSLIDKHYEFEHYQRLSNKLNNKVKEVGKEEFKKWIEYTYSNRVFIIDEIHNLKIKDLEEKENTDIKRYEAVLNILKYAKNIKIILLSATPMAHKANEIIDIINLLLINDNRELIKIKDVFDKTGTKITNNGKKVLADKTRGYISYLGINELLFPKKIYSKNSINISKFIENKFHLNVATLRKSDEYNIIPCKLIGEHKKNYLNYINKKDLNIQDIIQLGIVNYNPSDKNSIYNINFELFKENTLNLISPKIASLIENIKSSKGPIFIYSNYKERGIYMIASALLKNGIDVYSSKDKQNNIFSNKFKSKRTRPKNRLCAICNNKENEKHINHEFKPLLFDFIVGDTLPETQKELIKKFNSPENINGEKLKILIGSSVLKEGVSFLKVRQLHILEPWHNKSRLEQIIGRGVRTCSHKSLKPEERNITIFMYASILNNTYETDETDKNIKDEIKKLFKNTTETFPIELAKNYKNNEPLLSYDIIMYKRAEILDDNIKEVELVLKKNAFDCATNKELNKSEKYVCNGFPEDYNFELDENDIDTSTFNSIFLTPYIDYTISIIKQYFSLNKILYYSKLKENNRLQDTIYKQNDYYVLRKALDLIVPIKDDMKNFQHIIKHKNLHGYIFIRQIDNDIIYIFKDFDDQKKFIRSEFEISPLYENLYDYNIPNLTFKNYLNIIERQETSKRGKEIYLNVLTSEKQNIEEKEEKEGQLGNIALETIKKLDPIAKHKNDGEYIGITLSNKIFKNKIWIREGEKNKNKIGKNIKQYTYGQVCETFTRTNLTNIIQFLWEKVNKNKQFYKDNLKKYQHVLNNDKEMRKKDKRCNFIHILLQYHNDNKTDGKTWLKKL